MLLVDGRTCAESTRRCAEPDANAPTACRRYDTAECRKGLTIRVCVDRYEYPNLEGMLPAAVVTFEQARAACGEEGKRLCTETEWSFACEGPTGLAFSYGDLREDGACNVGRPVPAVRAESLWEARDIGPVLERVDARVPSGSTARCTSSFGVRDLIGNVEEWVKSDSPGFDAALRGGEYSSEPSCRTVRQIRQPGFRQFDTGFRCCRDPLVRVQRRAAGDE
jgi:formylglycine-generating enzyme